MDIYLISSSDHNILLAFVCILYVLAFVLASMFDQTY